MVNSKQYIKSAMTTHVRYTARVFRHVNISFLDVVIPLRSTVLMHLHHFVGTDLYAAVTRTSNVFSLAWMT